MSAGKLGKAKCPRCGATGVVRHRRSGGGIRQHRNPDRSPGAPWECPQTPLAELPLEPAQNPVRKLIAELP